MSRSPGPSAPTRLPVAAPYLLPAGVPSTAAQGGCEAPPPFKIAFAVPPPPRGRHPRAADPPGLPCDEKLTVGSTPPSLPPPLLTITASTPPPSSGITHVPWSTPITSLNRAEPSPRADERADELDCKEGHVDPVPLVGAALGEVLSAPILACVGAAVRPVFADSDPWHDGHGRPESEKVVDDVRGGAVADEDTRLAAGVGRGAGAPTPGSAAMSRNRFRITQVGAPPPFPVLLPSTLESLPYVSWWVGAAACKLALLVRGNWCVSVMSCRLLSPLLPLPLLTALASAFVGPSPSWHPEAPCLRLASASPLLPASPPRRQAVLDGE